MCNTLEGQRTLAETLPEQNQQQYRLLDSEMLSSFLSSQMKGFSTTPARASRELFVL